MRILLFIITNLAVVLVLGIVLSILGPLLGIDSQSYSGLLLFSAVFGFGGAFISLALSKWMALRSINGYVIKTPKTSAEKWLLEKVHMLADKSGIGHPDVAIYQSPDMNAFATGMSRNNALVAVSTGLLDSMSEDEIEAVLAHEVSHVANGDMITLSLIQGVVNTFVIFMARFIASVINSALRDNRGGGLGGIAYFFVVMILEVVFGVLASIIVMWFSRKREFSADSGAAKLVGSRSMIAALERLKRSHESQLDGTMVAFGITPKRKISRLFMSHPPLDERIQALREQR